LGEGGQPGEKKKTTPALDKKERRGGHSSRKGLFVRKAIFGCSGKKNAEASLSGPIEKEKKGGGGLQEKRGERISKQGTGSPGRRQKKKKRGATSWKGQRGPIVNKEGGGKKEKKNHIPKGRVKPKTLDSRGKKKKKKKKEKKNLIFAQS